MTADWRRRADRNYQRIKAFYEGCGGTKWSEISADPRLFNRVWRWMLRCPAGDGPPPVAMR